MSGVMPICTNAGECFARNDAGRCTILTECLKPCSFQKTKAEYAEGKKYYGRRKEKLGL